MIEAGRVLVGGSVAGKAARMVDAGEAITISGEGPRFVSRGGEKLDGALERFGLDVAGRRVLDAGASTGGFTDCVLQRGAASVVAVDVGHGQLHESLRAHPLVEVHERLNIRHVESGQLGPSAGFVVADLSFISLRTVLPALVGLAAPGADMVVLVKPQFEAGKVEASRARGVIRDPAIWERTLSEVMTAAADLGLGIMGVMVSPIRGADGNVEFLLHARLGASAADGIDVFAHVAVAEATAANVRPEGSVEEEA